VSDEIKVSELKAVGVAVRKNFTEQKEFLSELVKEKSVNPARDGFNKGGEDGVARLIRKK